MSASSWCIAAFGARVLVAGSGGFAFGPVAEMLARRLDERPMHLALSHVLIRLADGALLPLAKV